MPDPKDRWDKAQVVFGAIGAIMIPAVLLLWGQKYKEAEEYRADRQKETDIARADRQWQVESARADASTDAQIRAAKAGMLTQLIDSLAGQDGHKQELAFRAVQVVMPNEAPAILELVKGWQGTPATAAATVEKVLEEGKRQAIRDLFNGNDQGARGRAYEQLIRSAWRTDPAVADAILKMAEEHFEFQRGIDNAVVTLRDMSRDATHDPSVRQRILAFADKVEAKYPGLVEDTASLRKWIKEDRKPQ